MSLIQVNQLTFQYENHYDIIFDHVSFRFDTNFKTALIGRNARGKTTFLKLLMGEYEYQGEIIKSEECEYFPYEIKNKDLLTLDICLEIAPEIQSWQLERELHYLDLEGQDLFYRPFSTLSMGEQTKVLLAVLFLKRNSFLLIDEPTNHLDTFSRAVVAKYLKRQKGFLLVSHDRHFIDMCCDHIIAINMTTIEVVNGTFSSWYDNKMKKDEHEEMKNARLKKDISRLETSRQKTASWSQRVENSKVAHGKREAGVKADRGYVGHKAAKMMKRSKNIEKRQIQQVEEKKKLLKDVEEYDDLKITPLTYFQTNLVSFLHVSLYYQEKILFKDLTFSIQNKERILLKGKNGCGKSSVIRALLNQSIGIKGEINRGSRLKISYVPQDCSMLSGSFLSFVESYDVDTTLVMTILRKLGFSRSHFEKNLEDLSEGQKKKVMLAISLATSAHLYIWDEPLNYIDIYSRMQIEKMVLEYQPTLLFVEHDYFFQEKIATKVIDFDELI
ncbi:ribosomal protection-like ABC-F family protein [Longibaculum muris]|uniref:ribosomal protection-like ABC-F family protein n=1 Tax=Longibaculum muris TaxID=1796628 RepID=UPI0022E8AB7E|nr:ABC-F type ribosomal protection protein [Longibaculum muris]